MKPLKGKLVLSLFAFAALVLGSAMSARADIIVVNQASGTGTNVLLTNGQVGTTIVGTTNTNPALPVNFTTTGGTTLTSQASGQATIQAQTGNLTNINFGLGGGGVITTAVFNVFNVDVAGASNTGTITLTLTGSNFTAGAGQTVTNGGTTLTQTLTVSENGNNFFTITAINGQTISRIALTGATGVTFGDLRQVRLEGGNVPAAIPEPATMILLGTGLAGVAAKVRRRRKSE